MKPVVGDLRSAFKISTQIDFFIRSEERLNATDKRSTCHFQHRFHHKYFGLAPGPRAAHVAPSLPTSTRREMLPAWRGVSRDVPGDSATSRLSVPSSLGSRISAGTREERRCVGSRCWQHRRGQPRPPRAPPSPRPLQRCHGAGGAGGAAAQAAAAAQQGLCPLPAPSSTSCLLARAGIDGERFGRPQTRGLSRRAAPIHHGPFITE